MLAPPRRFVAGVALSTLLALPARAGAQEIQLTGPLCGAPALRRQTALRTGLELTATGGALAELDAQRVAWMPAVGLETRLMVAKPLPDKLRTGPALAVATGFDLGARRTATAADVGWAFERLVFDGQRTAVELSATAGATGRFGEGNGSSPVALGLHAAASVDLRLDWPGPASKPRVLGVGVDVRGFDRAPPMVGLTLRFGGQAPKPNDC